MSFNEKLLYDQEEIALTKAQRETQIILKQSQKDAEQLQSENDILENNIKHLKDQKKELENEIKIREISAESQAHAIYENELAKLQIEYSKQEKNIKAIFKDLVQETEKVQKELNSLKETRAAAITAAQQEKIISENKNNYCLILPAQEQGDIEILKNTLKKISKPRSIRMAI